MAAYSPQTHTSQIYVIEQTTKPHTTKLSKQAKCQTKGHTVTHTYTCDFHRNRLLYRHSKQTHPRQIKTTAQRHIIIYHTTDPTRTTKQIDKINHHNKIQTIVHFKHNKCPFILRYYYEGCTLLDTPTSPKTGGDTYIILTENQYAAQTYPIPPTASHQIRN